MYLRARSMQSALALLFSVRVKTKRLLRWSYDTLLKLARQCGDGRKSTDQTPYDVLGSDVLLNTSERHMLFCVQF